MKLKLDTTSQFFTREQAERVAAEMNAGDDDWTYRPNHDPRGTGYSFIEVYDENGEFVSKL